MNNEEINFTPVIKMLEIAEGKHEFSISNKALLVTGLVVLNASEGKIPIEMELGSLQIQARIAIEQIVGKMDEETLNLSDIMVAKLLEERKI